MAKTIAFSRQNVAVEQTQIVLGYSRRGRLYGVDTVTKNSGVAICAPIAPYDAVRRDVRELIEGLGGGFILVHVSTPLEVCEQRDRKGLYAKARAGIIKEFTGISDPYEVPENADLSIDTAKLNPEEAVQEVLLHLESLGYIGADRS